MKHAEKDAPRFRLCGCGQDVPGVEVLTREISECQEMTIAKVAACYKLQCPAAVSTTVHNSGASKHLDEQFLLYLERRSSWMNSE